MGKFIHKISIIFAIVIGMILPIAVPSDAYAQHSISNSNNRYNIVFVIDNSGSMNAKHEPPSDPEGYRFEAVQLFLDRLDLEGHNVGVILFNDTLLLDTGIYPVKDKTDRERIVSAIKTFQVGGDTDIGSALLEAVSELNEAKDKNALESVVVLLTDGKTDLNDVDKLKISNENRKQAIEKAAGIYVFGAFLNYEGKQDNQEVYDIVRGSRNNPHDPEILNRYYLNEDGLISGLDNQYAEIQKSEDLMPVINQFFNYLKGIPTSSISGKTDDRGDLTPNDIPVPLKGTAEINITINFTEIPSYIILTDPKGEKLHYGDIPDDSNNVSLNSLDDFISRGSTYWNIKLQNPEAGKWTLNIHSQPNVTMYYDIVLSNNVEAKLEVIQEDNKLICRSWLTLEGAAFENEGYDGYSTPKLVFWNDGNDESDSEEREMVLNEEDKCFDVTIEPNGNGLYHAKAIYGYGFGHQQIIYTNEELIDFTADIVTKQNDDKKEREKKIVVPPPPPVIFIVFGGISLIAALVLALQKCKHIVRIETDNMQNERVMSSGDSISIIGGPTLTSDGATFVLNKSPSFLAKKHIAKLETKGFMLPVLKRHITVSADSDSDMSEPVTLEDGVNQISIRCGMNTVGLDIWYKEEGANVKNNVNLCLFIICAVLGICLMIIGMTKL